MRSKIKICLWQKKSNLWNFHFFLHKSIVNASIWCQKTSRSVCQHFWMKSKSLVFGGFLDLSGENGSNIVNNQLTGLILLCKVFETSSQSSKCLLVLPYQWLVRHRQKKFHLSLVFAYCTFCYIQCGNYRIFLPLRFYVKSILGISEVQKLPF